MFGFLKKKPSVLKPTILAPVVLPASFAKTRENCLSGIGQYIHWITEVHGYLPEEIPPVIHRARSVLAYLDCLDDKGHGRYVAGIRTGEFDPDLTAEELAELGADELQSVHADAVHWLETHADAVTPEMYVVKTDELKALDKRSTGPLRQAAFKLVVALVSKDPSVSLVPDGANLKAERDRIVNGDAARDLIRLRQLEKNLSDPLIVGFRLALGWQTLKKDNALVQITGIRVGSRNHHPSDPKGIVYWIDSTFGPLLGYQDKLGSHLAVSVRKPGEPPIDALRPGDVAFSVSSEQVNEAIRLAKDDDIAFLAVALLDGHGLGKDITYMAFERQMKIEGLTSDPARIYRVVAASDSSVWLAIVTKGTALLAKPDLRTIDVVFHLLPARIEALRKESQRRHR